MIQKFKRYADEFKTFAIKGNVIDMAVGIIIGAAFGKIVDSMVKDIIMPPMGWIMGKVDFTNLYLTMPTTLDELTGEMPKYPSLEAAQAAGAVTINYGIFINTLISFLFVSLAVFMLIKFINKLRASVEKQEETVTEATTKTCPKCYSEININATRCPFCTSELN